LLTRRAPRISTASLHDALPSSGELVVPAAAVAEGGRVGVAEDVQRLVQPGVQDRHVDGGGGSAGVPRGAGPVGAGSRCGERRCLIHFCSLLLPLFPLGQDVYLAGCMSVSIAVRPAGTGHWER